MNRIRLAPVAWTLLILFAGSDQAFATAEVSANLANPQAVGEVASGTRTEANAAWWGFDEEDATDALQSAFDSKARRITVPYMGKPWIVRPLSLRSDQKIVFEPGVVILAKQGEFRGQGDSLFTISGCTNVVLHGYGATFKMRKTDYMAPPYDKAEWRMGLSLRGCSNIRVEGLRIESSGGDGIYIDGGAGQRRSKDIVIRNVTCYDNHRQGMSVISAENLLVEGCVFANTWGTAPAAGIDLEPDGHDQSLVNIVVRNCRFENNEGHELLVYLKNLRRAAPDVSIRFENCLIRKTMAHGKPVGVKQGIGRDDSQHGWSGISVAAVNDEGPNGIVEFVHCVVENTGKECVRIFDKSASRIFVRFEQCHFRNPWQVAHPTHWQARVPIHLEVRRPKISKDFGGIVFDDCHIYDPIARPALALEPTNSEYGLRDVQGLITVHGPGEPRMALGQHTKNITLQLADAPEKKQLDHKPNADAE